MEPSTCYYVQCLWYDSEMRGGTYDNTLSERSKNMYLFRRQVRPKVKAIILSVTEENHWKMN